MPSGLTYKIYNGEDMSLRGFAPNVVKLSVVTTMPP